MITLSIIFEILFIISCYIRVPCFQIWTYEVEAETEEDAIKQVIAGTAEVVESIVEEHDYDESEYKVEEDEDDDISDDIVELERGENNK